MSRRSTAYVIPVGVDISTLLEMIGPEVNGVAFEPGDRAIIEVPRVNGHATSTVTSHPWRGLSRPRLPVPPREQARTGTALRSSPVVTTLLVSMDCVALICALVLSRAFDIVGCVYVAGVLALLALRDMHRPRLNLRPGDDSLRIAEALVIPIAVIALVAAESWPRLPNLIRLPLYAAVLLPACRAATYTLIRRLRKRGALAERTLIIGAGTVGTEIARVLTEHREYGLVPVGFVDADRIGDVAQMSFDPGAPRNVIRQLAVTRIIVAFSKLSYPDLVSILRGCETMPIKVYVVPRLFELGVTNTGSDVEDVWGFPLVRVKRPANCSSARLVKRMLDLVVGSLLLVLSAPVFLLVAAAVRLSSPGPVFFRQQRLGENGRLIEMLKFRTLLCNDDSDETWTVGNDDRRTFVGRYLRKTGLDELPQILNVLRGDMSLVGPRPERPHFANRFAAEVPGYADRQRVPQGITGWAQVHGLRGDTPIPERARFDNYYIEHWTLWRDMQILARTVAAVLGKRGA
jgi:exopolysaccharide biosynthesis polyprenyl glycosylphosphotransferase